MNKSLQLFDGLDHQYTPEDFLLEIDAHMVFNMWEQPPDPVAYNQWHEENGIYTVLFIWNRFKQVSATSWR